jgi:hypothetical protein
MHGKMIRLGKIIGESEISEGEGEVIKWVGVRSLPLRRSDGKVGERGGEVVQKLGVFACANCEMGEGNGEKIERLVENDAE